MKSTGIIRRVDELGRIVIPIELRNNLKIAIKDPVEIYSDGNTIVLKRHEDTCVFCGSSKNLVPFKDKLVCQKCSENIFMNSGFTSSLIRNTELT